MNFIEWRNDDSEWKPTPSVKLRWTFNSIHSIVLEILKNYDDFISTFLIQCEKCEVPTNQFNYTNQQISDSQINANNR